MSLFEENSKFGPLAENDEGVQIEDIEKVFKSYDNNVALLIKEYHDYFEWESSPTISDEPTYVNNANIMMKYFWEFIEDRLSKYDHMLSEKFDSYHNTIEFIYQVESELDAISRYGELIDVYQGIVNEWENYDDKFINDFLAKVNLFDKKFCDFIIKKDISEELTNIVKEKQEYNETLQEVKDRVKRETVEEKEYDNNLCRDEEYQLINDMIKSAQNYMNSFIHNLYVDEKLYNIPHNPAFDEVYPDRLFYSTELTKDELLKYIVKPSYGIEDAHNFLRKIYDYMWEYIPEEEKMRTLTYAILDVAEYDYHKNIMTLESISATSDKKATTLLACEELIKTIEKKLDYAKFEFGYAYERDEELCNYVDNILNEFRHRFNRAYDRRMLLIFPELVEKYNKAKDELHLAYNAKTDAKEKENHERVYDKLMGEIKNFIEQTQQDEVEKGLFR